MSALIDSLVNAAKRAGYYRTGEEGLLYEAAQRLTQADIDAAHAAALERESIAGWVESYGDGLARLDDDLSQMIRDMATEIRNGRHSLQPTTSGDSRGPGVPQVPEGTPRHSTDTNGPERPETGMDSSRPSPESEDA